VREQAVQPDLPPEANRAGASDVPVDVPDLTTDRLDGAEIAAAIRRADVESTTEMTSGELPMPETEAPERTELTARAAPAPAEVARVPEPPRRSLRYHLPFALVLLVAAAGVVRISQYHWRQGSVLIGGALLIAALLRAVLPGGRAGLIAVRGRVVDVLTYGALAACVLFIALTLQNGPYG
jgi:hypothetical protein